VVFSGLFAIAWVYYLRPALAPETSAPVSVFVAVVTYLFGSGLARAAFAPSMPQWRLVPISEQSSVQIGRGIHLLLAVVTLNVVIQFAFDAVNLTALRAPDLASVKSFLVTSLVAVLLMMLCMPRLWQVPQSVAVSDGVGHSSHSNNWLWPVARLLVALAALAMLFASLLGYRLVADFILNATVSTLGLLAVAFGLHALCSEGLNLLLARDFGPAAAVKRLLALSEDGAKSLNFWLTAVVDFALFVVSVAGVLAFWGVPLTDMWSATLSLAQGIQVGSYKLSLIDMALAVMVFGVVVGVTRLIQRFFERLLPRTRLDIGMRTAVSAALGYIGVSIALLVAISTLGIDLTKLALIAGALSVGIGFGLQNIVNNFVSGLILLIERPVKIGDWVVIGDIEGTVKQINVRSTLIETFNHADVIIPNSDLLQTALVNWTHRNRLGRVDIAVGVSYSSNVEKVEQALLACAEEHARILRWPAPQVLFMDFGASSLDFQLRVHIADIEERLAVSSDVRKAVIRVFRAQNIEIPFPQTDVWMRMPNAVPRDDG
jgi:potassium efflux system protein